MITAQTIKSAREKLNETQGQFGKRFGVKQPTVHRWERDGVPQKGAASVLIAERLAAMKKRKSK